MLLVVQWDLSNTDTIGTKYLSQLMRCPYFRGRIICIYIKLGRGQVS